jgi:hypothetical protein
MTRSDFAQVSRMSTIMQVVDRIRALKLDDKIPCDESFDLQVVDISESLRFVASREARAAVTLKIYHQLLYGTRRTTFLYHQLRYTELEKMKEL